MKYNKLNVFIAGRHRTIKVYTDLIHMVIFKLGFNPDDFEAESEVAMFIENAFREFNFDKDGNKDRERFSYYINRLLIFYIADTGLLEQLCNYRNKEATNRKL